MYSSPADSQHILSGPDSKSMAAEDMKKSMTQSSVVSDGAIMMMV